MPKVAIVTDSNSGITKEEADRIGVCLVPMPFMIDGGTFFEGVNLTQEDFFSKQAAGSDISTSQPSPESVMGVWDNVLRTFDQVVYIPMSSGLSGSCQSARMLSEDYDGKVEVVNNQRISVTQKQSVLDAVMLATKGKSAAQIREILEKNKMESSIYIMLDTLYYLKKGGRITPAAAALGTLLKLKPVLTIQGDKLDAFAKARTVNHGKTIMKNAMKADMEGRLGGCNPKNIHLYGAYSHNPVEAEAWHKELEEFFPGFDIEMDPLSLSVSCHVGPGILAVACSRRIKV